MLSLIRRDPVVRMSPKWILVVALVALQAGAVRIGALMGGDSGIPASRTAEIALWLFIVWAPLSIYVGISGAAARAGSLESTLPLPTRRLWLAHMVALLLTGFATLAVSLAGLRIVAYLMRDVLRNAGYPSAIPATSVLGPALAAGLVLGVVLLQHLQPTLLKVRVTRRHVILSVACLAGLWGAAVLLAALPAYAIAVPVALSLVLGVRAYRSLPEVFSVVPREADREIGPAVYEGVEWADREEPRRAPSPYLSRSLFSTISRLFSKGLSIPATFYPFLVFLGLVLSGGLLDEGDLQYMTVPIVAYVLILLQWQQMGRLYPLDPLPVSRRYLFAAIVLPGLLMVCLGSWAGSLAAVIRGPGGPRVEYRQVRGDPNYYVFVPLSFCRIDLDGDPPEVTAPWGESHDAWRVPLYRGSRTVLYSPFTTPEGSSLDFVALQIQRAVQAVYGTEVPRSEISDRYLAVDPDGRVVPAGGRFALFDGHPGMKPVGRGPVLPVIFLMLGLLWFVLLAVYARSFRPGISGGFRKRLLVGLSALCLGLYLLPIPLTELRLLRISNAVGFLEILIRRTLQVGPAGPAAVWIVSALLFFAAYRLAESQFLGAELPAGKGEAGK